MKELFRERDFSRVGFCQSVLEAQGIATMIRNETLTGLTEFPIPDFFPALCVVNDADHARALEILREHFAADAARSEEERPCPACQEMNPGNFDLCWSCGAAIG